VTRDEIRFELRRRQAGVLLEHDVTGDHFRVGRLVAGPGGLGPWGPSVDVASVLEYLDTGQVVAVFNNPTDREPVAWESLADFERDWCRRASVAWR